MSEHRNWIARSILAVIVLGACHAAPASAQTPADAVAIVAPIIVKAIKPKPKNSPFVKFQGTVMHANIAQITVRGIQNELQVQTFPLSPAVSEQMQKIIDRGGYQYGDKVTVYFDPTTQQAVKIKGKPSRPI